MITPMIPTIGEKFAGFNSCTNTLLLSIPVKLSIQEVTVVPTFAPKITPAACASFIIPEFTSPTTITVVADDD